MDLRDKAYFVDVLGCSQSVIEDAPLLEWARWNGISPWEAQREGLREGIVPLRYLKNFRALSLIEQTSLCESRVIICGCGGLGGILVNLMARAGVGHLRLVDADIFSPTNLNRQFLCDVHQLSRPKAEVAAASVEAINPFVKVESFQEFIHKENAGVLLSGMDLVLDGLDNLQGRFLLAETARRMKIPFIHAAVTGWWGQISTFLPDSPTDLRSVYGDRRSRDPMEDATGVLGATAATIGSLEAFEAIRLLVGRAPAYVGRLLYFDGESGRVEIMPLMPL